TIFSRHLGNIGVASFRTGGPFEGLLPPGLIEQLLVDGGDRARPQHAYDASHRIVQVAHDALARGARPDLRAALDQFRTANAHWLASDALHAALCRSYRGAGHRDWIESDRDLWLTMGRGRYEQLIEEHAVAIDRYAFGQLLVAEEHARVRARCNVALYG